MKSQKIWIVETGKTEIREVEVPDPAPGEVQIRCLANGVCMLEVSIFKGVEPGPPCQAGHEGIGVVTKVGKGVECLAEGDCVRTSWWTQVENLPAAGRPKYKSVPSDPALFISEPVGCVAGALRSYDISPGDRVLLMGAGYMGLLNVQGLAHYPLSELVVTDINPARLTLASEFGATETIHAGTAVGDARLEELKDSKFDLVVEAAGAEATMRMAGDLTRNGGRLALFGWQHGERKVNMTRWHVGGLHVINAGPAISFDHNINTSHRAVDLLECGVFDQSKLITHRHSFTDVQQALEEAVDRTSDYIKGVLEFE